MIETIFSSRCVHCKKLESAYIFCSFCVRQIELLDPALRCQKCFSELINGACLECRRKRLHYHYAYAFEEGPMRSLYAEMQKRKLLFYAKGMAAYLFFLIEELDWEYDLITFPPQNRWQRWLKGDSLSALLAKKVAKRKKIPWKNLLYYWGESFDARKCQSRKLSESVLLISTRRKHLKTYADALYRGGAKRVFILTLF